LLNRFEIEADSFNCTPTIRGSNHQIRQVAAGANLKPTFAVGPASPSMDPR